MTVVDRVFFAVWAGAVALALVNATFNLFIIEVSWVLLPLPLVLTGLWAAIYWPEDQPRRVWFLLGLLVFAALAVLGKVNPAGIDQRLLHYAGVLLYIGWAARGVNMEPSRWTLVSPLAVAGLFAAYIIAPAHSEPWWAVAVFVLLITVLILALILSPHLNGIAMVGGALLATSYAATAQNEYLGGLPHATLIVLGSTYLAHLLLALGPMWSRPDDPEERPDIPRMAHEGPNGDH